MSFFTFLITVDRQSAISHENELNEINCSLTLDYDPTIPISYPGKEPRPEIEHCLNLIQDKLNQRRPSSNSNSSDCLNSLNLSKLAKHLKEHNDWPSWRFIVQIQLTGRFKHITLSEEKHCKGSAQINLLQAAVLLQNIDLIKLITNSAENADNIFIISDILTYELDLSVNDGWHIATHCKWILNANSIHLAAYWHPQSLIHLLKLDPSLINKRTGSHRHAGTMCVSSISNVS